MFLPTGEHMPDKAFIFTFILTSRFGWLTMWHKTISADRLLMRPHELMGRLIQSCRANLSPLPPKSPEAAALALNYARVLECGWPMNVASLTCAAGAGSIPLHTTSGTSE